MIVAQDIVAENVVLSDRSHRSGLVVDTDQHRRRVS